jgi:hypothetical protein
MVRTASWRQSDFGFSPSCGATGPEPPRPTWPLRPHVRWHGRAPGSHHNLTTTSPRPREGVLWKRDGSCRTGDPLTTTAHPPPDCHLLDSMPDGPFRWTEGVLSATPGFLRNEGAVGSNQITSTTETPRSPRYEAFLLSTFRSAFDEVHRSTHYGDALQFHYLIGCGQPHGCGMVASCRTSGPARRRASRRTGRCCCSDGHLSCTGRRSQP